MASLVEPARLDEFGVKARMLHSSTLADVLDGLGIWGVLPYQIGCVSKARGPVFGRAYTVRWAPVRKSDDISRAQASTWQQVRDFLAPEIEDGRGRIYVGGADDGVLCDFALAGGLSAKDLRRRRFEGVVLGGAIRDAHIVRELDLPVFASNFVPTDTQGNYRVVEAGAACRIEQVTIATGDWVFADESGCVAVPAAAVGEVIDRALAIEAIEARIEARIGRGERLVDVVDEMRRI